MIRLANIHTNAEASQRYLNQAAQELLLAQSQIGPLMTVGNLCQYSEKCTTAIGYYRFWFYHR